MIDLDFDARLDEYQATLAEEAATADERSYEAAARPNAVPVEATFADLRPGDYMTNEGPQGRWVRIIEIEGPNCKVKGRARRVADGNLDVLFEIPEPVTVSGETRYWVERPSDSPILIDLAARL